MVYSVSAYNMAQLYDLKQMRVLKFAQKAQLKIQNIKTLAELFILGQVSIFKDGKLMGSIIVPGSIAGQKDHNVVQMAVENIIITINK